MVTRLSGGLLLAVSRGTYQRVVARAGKPLGAVGVRADRCPV
jgi:hypothetical protein